MAGIALKSQSDFVCIMVPPEVHKKLSEKWCIFRLMASSVAAYGILIKYKEAIFLRLEVFKGFVLNLMLKAVDIPSRF